MSEAQFIQPFKPDVQPILELHRGTDGYVGFSRRTAAGQFEKVCSVRADELGEIFEAFISAEVDADSFCTINTMWLSANEKATKSRIVPTQPMAQWGNARLRYLTACYVDIDCYKLGITQGQAVGACIDAQDRGVIPPATLFTRSGRGIWALWMLHNSEDPSKPVRAWSEVVGTYRRIERELVRLFQPIGADAAAQDPARITRVPGSLHRGSKNRVEYWFQLNKEGKPYSYRIDELAALLGVRTTKYPDAIRKVIDPKRREAAKKGYKALHAGRLEKMMLFLANRGVIEQGQRNHTAVIFASCLQRAKVEEEKVIEQVDRFGKHQCRPPLWDSEIAEAIREGRRLKFQSYTIGDWLKLTQAEADLIGWPAAGSRPREADTQLRTRAERTRQRRELVRTLIEFETTNNARFPTVQQTMDFVESFMGDKPSSATINKDMGALGYTNPRRQLKQANDDRQHALPVG